MSGKATTSSSPGGGGGGGGGGHLPASSTNTRTDDGGAAALVVRTPSLHRAEMSGPLFKRRGGYGKHMPNAWQSRYFFLIDGVLSYYDAEHVDNGVLLSPDARPRGSIELVNARCVFNECAEGEPSEFAILVFPEGREKWKLCAETQTDYVRWLDALKRHAGRLDEIDEAGSELHDSSDINSNNNNSRDTQQQRGGGGGGGAGVSTSGGGGRAPLAHTHSSQGLVKKLTGKRLRLKKKGGGGFLSAELFETVFVLAALNTCLLLAVASPLAEGLAYLLLGNALLLRTLQLRGARCGDAASALESAREDLRVLSEAVQAAAATGEEDSAAHHQVSTGTGVATASSAVVAAAVETQAAAGAGRPAAGSTFRQVLVPPSSAAPAHTWARCDPATFNVRVGPDYSRFKRKAPSQAPIYGPFAVDVFCTKTRKDHVCTRIALPPELTAIDTRHAFVPPIFVVQIQIPSDPPASLFSSAEDGPGWAIVMYFRISEDALQQLRHLGSASPGLKLFAQYCEKAPIMPEWSSRFKVICYCSNLEELGVPSGISSYNAKPVLIRRTGSLHRGPGYMEKNVHVHKFANLAKQSIHLLSSRCGQMAMQIGFVVEGRDDTELPEVLFGCVAINKPQEERAEFLFEEDLSD